MKRLKRALVALAVVGLASGAAAPARAQTADEKAQADVLFEQGKKLMAESKYAEACAKLAESNRLDSGVGTMLFLGECYRLAGRPASAWAIFREADSVATRTGDARAKIAQAKVRELEPKLSRMTVQVPQAAPGLVVTRDGAPVAAAAWGVEIPVDPGSHVIEATAPQHKPWRATVSVAEEGERSVVTVPRLEPQPDAPPPPASTGAPRQAAPATPGPPPPQPRDDENAGGTQRALALGAAAIGLVGVGIGGYFGLHAKGQLDDADPHCGADGCDPAGFDLRTKARSNANLATVFFAAGGAFVVGGAVLYFTAPKKRAGLGVGAPGTLAGTTLSVRF
jgi:serine/threonine-protein kinase